MSQRPLRLMISFGVFIGLLLFQLPRQPHLFVGSHSPAPHLRPGIDQVRLRVVTGGFVNRGALLGCELPVLFVGREERALLRRVVVKEDAFAEAAIVLLSDPQRFHGYVSGQFFAAPSFTSHISDSPHRSARARPVIAPASVASPSPPSSARNYTQFEVFIAAWAEPGLTVPVAPEATMIAIENHPKMAQAVERAKAVRPRVTVISAAARAYSDTGSKGARRTVRFVVVGARKLAEGDCKAGKARIMNRQRFDDALKALANRDIVTLHQCDPECMDKSSDWEKRAMLVIDGVYFYTVERKTK